MSRKLLKAIRQTAIDRFPMSIEGIHGLRHWERVRENGVYLAKHSGGDLLVVELFAYLHDCCRESDGSDPEHGARAAEFAESLRGDRLAIDDDRFELLRYACEHHDKGLLSENPTVGSCWDADRLDLGRVGRRPNRKFLSTKRAHLESVIEWGYRRSRGRKARLKS